MGGVIQFRADPHDLRDDFLDARKVPGVQLHFPVRKNKRDDPFVLPELPIDSLDLRDCRVAPETVSR